MYRNELQYILNKSPLLKRLNGKVCSKNQLPRKKPKSVRAYIVNTHTSCQPGEHWIAIMFKGKSTFYFDSFALPPEEKFMLPFMERNSTTWVMNTIRYQHKDTNVCGLYCIFALHHYLLGDISTNYVMNYRDLFENDRALVRWFNRHYGQLYTESKTRRKIL